jgi:hypothetical protein
MQIGDDDRGGDYRPHALPVRTAQCRMVISCTGGRFRLSLSSLGFEIRHVGPVMTMEYSPDGSEYSRASKWRCAILMRHGPRCDTVSPLPVSMHPPSRLLP